MKRLMMKPLRWAWRMTSPVRRPIMRRIDRRSANLIAQALSSHDRLRPPSRGLDSIEASLTSLNHRIVESVTSINHSINALDRDVELSLNSVVRDLFRLQAKIDILQQSIDQQLSETNTHRSEDKSTEANLSLCSREDRTKVN